jgi:hypothetical protein
MPQSAVAGTIKCPNHTWNSPFPRRKPDIGLSWRLVNCDIVAVAVAVAVVVIVDEGRAGFGNILQS